MGARTLAGGSSPHTRGTRAVLGVPLRQTRFIPAHAGNTAPIGQASCHHAVHPRTRGEHLGRHARALHSDRFIPAHAGNTVGRWVRRTPAPVHPRTRGEHIDRDRPVKRNAGSSPHTRGTPPRGSRSWGFFRFIPAHAGNTCQRTTCARRRSVHPRTRGEHHQAIAHGGGVCGSSPHTRGTLIPHGRGGLRLRFIPAHAGNTPTLSF